MSTIKIRGILPKLPKQVKLFLSIFILVLSFGYGTGVLYISQTSGVTTKTIQENYIGNEQDEDAEEMKFKKSEKAILTMVHGHIISFALIFGVIGFMLFFSSYSSTLTRFLTIEPLISTVTTFGGVWLIWAGVSWMKYVVIISGALMHGSFAAIAILLLLDLNKKIAPKKSPLI